MDEMLRGFGNPNFGFPRNRAGEFDITRCIRKRCYIHDPGFRT